jgi:hypothetical protein
MRAKQGARGFYRRARADATINRGREQHLAPRARRISGDEEQRIRRVAVEGKGALRKVVPIFRQEGALKELESAGRLKERRRWTALPCDGANRRKPSQACAQRGSPRDFQQAFPQNLWKFISPRATWP